MGAPILIGLNSNGLHTSSSDPEEHITADYIGFDEDGNSKVYRDHVKQSEIRRWQSKHLQTVPQDA